MDAGEVCFGPFCLHLERRQLSRQGVPIKLGSRAIEILCLLVAARGQLVTKDQLLARVWQGVVVEENAIQVHVSALRKALDQGDPGSGGWVVTVPGRGYRFTGCIEEPPKSSPGKSDEPASFLDKPSIAVMPFSNLSGDAEQEYFADGISEDI